MSPTANHAAEVAWLHCQLPELQPLTPNLVAHRGFHCPKLSPERPLECTLDAYKHAWQAGILNCECDVRLSADDKILLLHDETLERLVPEGSSQAPKAIEVKAEDLAKTPLRQDTAQVALLEEALRTAIETGGSMVVELKATPGSSRVGQAVAHLFAEKPELLAACVVVMSFDLSELRSFAAAFPKELRRPKVLLLTCHPKETLNAWHQTIDLAEPHWPEVVEKHLACEELALDGFYIEWTAKLSTEHADSFSKLCQRAVVGVWQAHGQVDSKEEAARLVELGATFCNTDLPRSFS
ncbi:unnamed protein product [Effrenium voratum]|uniref:GP-PDE domain-containing protein n=1 Tax=Effrenium voratum TaxID=2562239 RepID=A0AA36MPF0_9DINO|nr:unnamed protein product [Effrenium voratum]